MPHGPEELPPPSAELVLLRVLVEAHLSTVSRKKGEAYLRVVGEKLAAEENMAAVFQIRPSAQHAAVRKSRRQAAAIYERLLPLFLARLGSGRD